MTNLQKDKTGGWAPTDLSAVEVPQWARGGQYDIPQSSRTLASIQPQAPQAPAAAPGIPVTPKPTFAAMGGAVDPQDAYTKFNVAVMDMLRQAQGTAGQEGLVAQQTALLRAKYKREVEPMRDGLERLSPQQMGSINDSSSAALDPQIDAVNNAMRSRQLALQNFEGVLGQMRLLGNDFVKNMKVPEETVASYIAMIENGVYDPANLPPEIAGQVLKALTPQSLQKMRQAIISDSLAKNPPSAGKGAGLIGYKDQNDLDSDFMKTDSYQKYDTALTQMESVDSILGRDRAKINWAQASSVPGTVATIANAVVRLNNPEITRINLESGEVYIGDSVSQQATQEWKRLTEGMSANPVLLATTVDQLDRKFTAIRANTQVVRARMQQTLDRDPNAAGLTLPELGDAGGHVSGTTDSFASARSALQSGEILVRVKVAYGDFAAGDLIAIGAHEFKGPFHEEL